MLLWENVYGALGDHVWRGGAGNVTVGQVRGWIGRKGMRWRWRLAVKGTRGLVTPAQGEERGLVEVGNGGQLGRGAVGMRGRQGGERVAVEKL